MNTLQTASAPEVILMIILASSAGCGTMYAPGKYALGTEETDFHWVESDVDLAKCVEVGPVQYYSLWGGFFMQWYAASTVIKEIRLQAEALGGNTVLLQRSEKGFLGSSAGGIAYRCNVNS